jgi:hypothetical protein
MPRAQALAGSSPASGTIYREEKSMHPLSCVLAAILALFSVASLAQPVAHRVTATDLAAAFLGNEIAAQARYGDQYVLVRGVFSSGGLAFNKQPYIVLDARKQSAVMQSGVQCFFDVGWMKTLGGLEAGSTVTVKGKVDRLVFGMVQLKYCSLE